MTTSSVVPASVGTPASTPTPFAPLSFQLDPEQRTALLDYWRSVTKRKWSILSLGLAVAAVAAAVAFSLPSIYRSTATVMIEPAKAKVVNIEEVYGGISQGREHYQTQVEIIKSRDVAIKTIKALKLWEVAEFDPRKASESWKYQLKDALGLIEPTPPWTEDTLADGVLGKFEDALTIEPIRLSQLVKVSFDSQNAELSARVVDVLTEKYVNNDREARFKLTQQASTWLQDRVSGLRQKLDASERALQAYRDGQGLVSLGGSAQSMDSQRISNLTEQLVGARVKRAENEGVYNDIKQLRAAGKADYSSVAAVMRHPSIVKAKEQEAAAQQKLSELSQRYGFDHTKIVQANAELQAAKQSVGSQMEAVAASLVRDYEISRATEQQLAGELGSARASVAVVNRKEAQLGILEREVQANRQLYELFIGRAKETSVSDDMQTQVARVVDPAAKGEQVRPKKAQITAVALLLGLMAGVMVSLLLDRLDNTLKGQEDAEEKLGQPLLTSLPVLSNTDRKNAMRTSFDTPDSMFAEAIRTARTGILLSSIDQPNKVILVTSSVPGEGKSVVAANMALAHSATKRTLLIDADMRRPAVSRGLGLAAGTKGLSNLTSGTATVEECVHSLAGTKLQVLPAGDIPPNPTELLLSQRFKSTISALSQIYDVIIVDSPPVELVSDALVISPQVTGTVYVVKAMETPFPLARKGLTRLQRSGAKILGVVLNQVDFKKAQKYYGQYSAYGQYGYADYGYKAKPEKPAKAVATSKA